MASDTQNAAAGPSCAAAKSEHAHSLRRIFVGPMPYAPDKDEIKEEHASNFASMHALRIYLQQGGRIEDWTEAKAGEYKQRLKERILESTAWYSKARAARRRRKTLLTTEWRGDTFEVGKVAGLSINMLAEYSDDALSTKLAGPSNAKAAVTVQWDEPARPPTLSTASRSKSDPGRPAPISLASAGSSSFVTAESHLSATSAPANISPETSDAEEPVNLSTSESRLIESAPSGDGHMLPSDNQQQNGALNIGVAAKTQTGLKSILRGPGRTKGKGKVTLQEPTLSGDDLPAPPSEVLDRSPDEVQNSSAAESAEASDPTLAGSVSDGYSSKGRNDIVMRDKMLVRILRCDHESLTMPFTETECRVARGVTEQEWGEFLLIWRKHRIELYEEHSIPCKERLTGHKHLAFVIPLQTGTKLSIFSSVDMSFCLICRPTPTLKRNGNGHRWLLHRSKRGLNIFILKPKSRSRAVDWVWPLWRELGDFLPELVEIICPLIHTRVRIQIPNTSDDDWKAFTRDYIINQCSRAMKDSFAWKTLMQLPISSGRKLELGWRSGNRLDWVWLRNSVEGQKRDWEVLYGLALQNLGNAVQLELHLAEHYPSQINSKDGMHVEEPPAIEGYAHMTRKRSRRTQVYLSTHDGFLCSLPTENSVMPPTPTDVNIFSKREEEIQKDERRRLRLQLVHARGFWDMRDILVVRRASHPATQDGEEQPQQMDGQQMNSSTVLLGSEEEVMVAPEVRRSGSDIEDEGGDTGMAKAANKTRLKMHRSFEVVLKNGKVLRFETHSTKHSVEWATHLRALVAYWKKRHRDDTLLEMNIIKTSPGSERITVSHRYDKKGHKLTHHSSDSQITSEYMNEYWNWCVLDGCRPVIKGGHLYTKSKIRGQYTLSHMILTGGWLVQFKINDNTRYHHQTKHINLVDAYVCSGYYAARALSDEEYDPNAPAIGKYFQDGLETKDGTEDTLFLLWYRPHTNHLPALKEDFNIVALQKMNAKRSFLICRARSKLECDSWCWALNAQIEKIVRASKERETRAREQGSPVS